MDFRNLHDEYLDRCDIYYLAEGELYAERQKWMRDDAEGKDWGKLYAASYEEAQEMARQYIAGEIDDAGLCGQ